MVMPASIAPTFEVVEAELPLHVLIRAFCAPALLDVKYEHFDREVLGKRGEVKLAGGILAVLPLHEQPQRLSVGTLDTFIRDRQHAAGCVARTALST